jgi:hypothetical protein
MLEHPRSIVRYSGSPSGGKLVDGGEPKRLVEGPYGGTFSTPMMGNARSLLMGHTPPPFPSMNVLYVGWITRSTPVINLNRARRDDAIGTQELVPDLCRTRPFRSVLRSCRRTGIPELIGGSDCPLVWRREQAK